MMDMIIYKPVCGCTEFMPENILLDGTCCRCGKHVKMIAANQYMGLEGKITNEWLRKTMQSLSTVGERQKIEISWGDIQTICSELYAQRKRAEKYEAALAKYKCLNCNLDARMCRGKGCDDAINNTRKRAGVVEG